MKAETIKKELKKNKEEISRKFQVKESGLFGSYVRNYFFKIY